MLPLGHMLLGLHAALECPLPALSAPPCPEHHTMISAPCRHDPTVPCQCFCVMQSSWVPPETPSVGPALPCPYPRDQSRQWKLEGRGGAWRLWQQQPCREWLPDQEPRGQMQHIGCQLNNPVLSNYRLRHELVMWSCINVDLLQTSVS